MDKNKQERLEAAGWIVAGPKEFLGLTAEDEAYIEVKVALAAAVKALRVGQDLSQVEAAERLRSSQSRVAKMEAADRSVSVDLLLLPSSNSGAPGPRCWRRSGRCDQPA